MIKNYILLKTWLLMVVLVTKNINKSQFYWYVNKRFFLLISSSSTKVWLMWMSFNCWKMRGEILVLTFELRWRFIKRLIVYWRIYYENISLVMSFLLLLLDWFAMNIIVDMSRKYQWCCCVVKNINKSQLCLYVNKRFFLPILSELD